MDRITSIISPLNEKNYATWRIQIKMSLIKDDLYRIVDGSETAPTDVNSLMKFNLRKDRALAIIVLSMEPKLLYLIGEPNDPHVVWSKLQNIFQTKSWSNKLRLKKRLYNISLQQNGNLQEHLKLLIEIFDELAVIGEPMKEEDRVICLLASLPDKFSTLVTALEASDKVPLWDNVVERLLHQDSKIMELDKDSTEKSLLTNKKNFNKSSDKKLYNKKITCFECGKLGHIRANCYKFIAKNRNKSKDKNFDNVVNYVEDDSEILYASSFSVEPNSIHSKNMWIVDSGCTQHMSNNRNLFSSYTSSNGNSRVQVGDGSPLNVLGKGVVN